MKMFKRMLLVGALAGAGTILVPAHAVCAQDQAGNRASIEEIGQMISAIGLQPVLKDTRYDFTFQAAVQEQDWALSMSVAMSKDNSAVWIIAWLNEIPKASNDVPRAALLRLLSQNDQLGDGKFFAYIPASRRLVMQRSVPNSGLTSAKLRLMMQDLGTSVVENYPVWSVENWNPTGTPSAPVTTPAAAIGTPKGVQTGVNESKFEQPVRR